MSESFDLSALTEEYRDEARQQVGVLDTALLELEREGALGDEVATGLLRALHTLKGNSGMMGFAPIQDLVHAVESVLKDIEGKPDQVVLDDLFAAAGGLRRAIDRAGTAGQDQAFEPLKSLSADLSGRASAGPGNNERGRSEKPPIEPADQPKPSRTKPTKAAEQDPNAADEILRIPFGKLDALLNQVHEMFGTVEALQAMQADMPNGNNGMGRRFRDGVERLELVAETLRSSAMELRLVPLRRVFSRFPSLIRDLARDQGKQVEVVLEGEDIELDKSTVDALSEPLLHLVRNAVDHGISNPEVRKARGYPPEGRLALRASQRGDSVRIEIEDDGAGLDRAAILARARQLGLVSEQEELSREEIDQLIFSPGFSTRELTSTVSGRGIGLDVVRGSATRLRGDLRVEDVEGGGTRFVLELPLTLAIVPSVVFEADGETFAVPSSDVEEILRRVRAEHVGASEVLRVRGELVPMASIGRIFGWANGDGALGEEIVPFVVHVRRGDRAAALRADNILEERGVVAKPLPRYLGQIPGVSGATLMPGGQVALLLEVGGLLDLNMKTNRRQPSGERT